ncbi:MAG: hypothetical protein V4543_03765 [Bacteroidota bacterium]
MGQNLKVPVIPGKKQPGLVSTYNWEGTKWRPNSKTLYKYNPDGSLNSEAGLHTEHNDTLSFTIYTYNAAGYILNKSTVKKYRRGIPVSYKNYFYDSLGNSAGEYEESFGAPLNSYLFNKKHFISKTKKTNTYAGGIYKKSVTVRYWYHGEEAVDSSAITIDSVTVSGADRAPMERCSISYESKLRGLMNLTARKLMLLSGING